MCRSRWSDLSFAYTKVWAANASTPASRLGSGAHVALRCSHQFGATDLVRSGDLQYHGQGGHVLPPLNLAHMRTLDPSQRSQLLLGNFLILAKRAHSFTESQGWLGFIGLCLGDDLVEQYASALAEASSND